MSNSLIERLSVELAAIRADGLFKDERVIASPQGGVIDAEPGGQVLNFCANNYLGLANHPELVAAGKHALERYGYGMASVRFICGTQEEHKALEARLSAFLGIEDTILYSSCFDANTGLFETLLGEEDAIISDALNHASVIDGIRLCKARRYRYANNDMADLERCLREAGGARHRMIATDGVFSMDGIIADLPAICDLAERYDATVMVDDSHAVGCRRRQRGRHARALRRRGPRRHPDRDARQGARRRLGRLHQRAARGGRDAAPALAPLPLLQHARAGDRRRLADRARPGRGRATRCARASTPTPPSSAAT